jgi:hypothetical protein
MIDVKRYLLAPGLLDMEWWYVVRHYETPEQAEKAFVQANVYAARLKGKAEIAGYRLLDDLPPDGKATVVVITGLIRERVEEVAPLLGGEPWPMDDAHIHGLILRRLRFMVAAGELGVGAGVHIFQHGTGLGVDGEGRVVPVEGLE